MNATPSRVAETLGGVSQSGGWLAVRFAAVGVALLAVGVGGGCLTSQNLAQRISAKIGWNKPTPAAMLVTTFEPTIYHLPDPTKEGQMNPGLAGMFFLVDGQGQFTEVNGTFTVFIEDVTPRPVGVPSATAEVWEFDAVTLKRLKSSHEKFGKNTVVFLPWPENWKGVTNLRISTKYEPTPGTDGITLTGPVQPLTVDFNSLGKPVWMEKNEPIIMRGIPNLKKDMARGFAAPNMGTPQLQQNRNTGTMPASATQPQPGTRPPGALPPVSMAPMNMANPASPFPQVSMTAPNTPKLPDLPPPLAFDPNHPTVNTQTGANGSTIHTTAMALPVGETMPPGWKMGPGNTIVPIQGNDPRQIAVPSAPPQIAWPPVSTPPNVPTPTTFDPNGTVGNWANQNSIPLPPPNQDPNAPLRTVTIPGQR